MRPKTSIALKLTGRGYPVFHGAMGENLTARGLDPGELLRTQGSDIALGRRADRADRIRVQPAPPS